MSNDVRRVVLVKPGDVLLIGNTGALDLDAVAEASAAISQLQSALGLTHVLLFDEDIDLSAVTPNAITPAASATVLRILDQATLNKHRELIAMWLRDNGIDAGRVADRWISIELAGGQPVVRYQQHRVTVDGRYVLDPDDDARAWTEECSVPMVVELELPTD